MANISRYFKLNRRGESQAHVVYAVTFTIIAVVALVGLIMVNTEADNSFQSTTISNEAPTISNLIYGVSATSDVSTLNLAALGGDTSAEGTRFTGVVTATVNDNNGCADIYNGVDKDNYALKIYRQLADGSTTESAAAACAATNGTDCYVGASTSVTLSSCTSSTAYDVTWPVTQFYFLDATAVATDYATSNWAARFSVTDTQAALTSAVDTFEVNALAALDVDATTDFGTLAVGANSNSIPLVIKHTGNINIEDYNVGYNQSMQCTQNSFNGDNVKLTQTGVVIGSAVAMSAVGSPNIVNANIAKATSMATSATDALYAYISIPSNAGVRGSCSNTATYTAINNQAEDSGI